jgi:hypothetical protein
MKNNEIVHVPDVILRFQLVLHVLVQLVQIDVRQELAGPVAERHPLARPRVMVLEDHSRQPEDSFIWDSAFDNYEQRVVVDGVEVAFDVAFQGVADDLIRVSGS